MPLDSTRRYRIGARNVFWATSLGIIFHISSAGAILNLFAIKLGCSDFQIGLLSSASQIFLIPRLLVAPIADRIGRKRILVPCIRMAALGILLYAVVPLVYLRAGRASAIGALLVLVLMANGFQAIATTGWMPLLKDFVPERIRGRFFGMLRSAWQSVSVVYSWIVGLWWLGNTDPSFFRFQAVFIFGGLCGLIRTYFMRRIPEKRRLSPQGKWFAMEDLKAPLVDRRYRMFLLFTAAQAFALGFSGPFAVVFMKRTLVETPSFIVSCAALMSVGAIVTLIGWGKLADRYGNRVIFSFSLAGLMVVHIVWLFLTPAGPWNRWILAFLFLSIGAACAGLELGSTRCMLGWIPQEGESSFVAMCAAMQGLATAIGNLSGGIILDATRSVAYSVGAAHCDNYRLLFLATSALLLIPFMLREKLSFGDLKAREVLRKTLFGVGP